MATTVLLFVAGLGLLIGGAEALVRGAVRLASAIGVSPLVIGLTVVAYGTSAPELAVSTKAALAGQADLAVGNVVGSNICNVLLILGVSAVITPLLVNRQLLRFDLWVMLGVALLAWLLGADGRFGRTDGLLLASGGVLYTAWSIRQSRRENAAVQAEYARQFGSDRSPSRVAWIGSVALVAIGLAMLTFGARWLVQGAAAIAMALGVSQLLIGLTIVAVGTSLPELATSVVAAIRGERDVAVGNIVGSNIFNILIVLGAAAAVAPAGVAVNDTALRFDFPVMVVVSVVCLPIFYSARRIDRWEGALFLACYVAYTVCLILMATAAAR